MIGKKFFSIVALGGTAMSVVESVGSFAQENLPDYGFLFECLDKGCTYRPRELTRIPRTLQNLVTHFHLNRPEAEKLLGSIRSFLEKYKDTDLDVPDINEDLWHEALHGKEDGRIGFGATRSEDGFDFFIVKAAASGINFCPAYDWSFGQHDIDKILNTNLNSIEFWPTGSFLRFFKRSDLPQIIFRSIIVLLGAIIFYAAVFFFRKVRIQFVDDGDDSYHSYHSLSSRATVASTTPYNNGGNQDIQGDQEMILLDQSGNNNKD